MDAAVVDLGQIRGLALFRAKGRRVRLVVGDSTYFVPSASGNGGYVVDVAKSTCSCPAHEESGIRCPHLWCVAYFRHELAIPDDERVVSKTVRLTYPQSWGPYNRAQCEEKSRVQILLRGLCDGITEPKQTIGRPRLPLNDAIFCAAMKVYVGMSGRRATTDLRACAAAGYIDHAPSFASVFRTIERPDLTPILQDLIEQSVTPLRAIETTFATDSTGFATATYARWHDEKYGEERKHQRWIKAHAMIGTLTNIVTSVKITESYANDSPEFVGLVERTAANGFDVQEVSADKAYLSHENLAAVERLGGQAYIPFKSNSGRTGSPAWERLYHVFALNKEAFLSHYHRRSNVESTFSAMKRKFGPSLRSRNVAALFNEALLKCLVFNLSMLVHSIHELGIDPKFWMPRKESA